MHIYIARLHLGVDHEWPARVNLIYIYIYIYIYTHTHTHIYIYIYKSI